MLRTCSSGCVLVAGRWPPAAGRRPPGRVLTGDVEDEQRRRSDESDLGGATYVSFLSRAARSFPTQRSMCNSLSSHVSRKKVFLVM
jgi:hypothetical protein